MPLSSLPMATSTPLHFLPLQPHHLLIPKSRSSPHLLLPNSSFPTFHFHSPPFTVPHRRRLPFLPFATPNSDPQEIPPADVAKKEEEEEFSTFPDRFRYLLKPAPSSPLIWPWAVGLVFLVYCWRTVLWELSNWTKVARAITLGILQFLGFLLMLPMAVVFRYIVRPLFHYISGPIAVLLGVTEYCLHFICSVYSSIVAFAPVPELTRIILFTTTVLAVAEATVPDSVNDQPHLLTVAGIIGFGAVMGFVPEVMFWLLLLGMFCYSRLIKKRDVVSAALPSAAVLAAVGEPWVRGVAIASYLALAISQHYKETKGGAKTEISVSNRRLPVPLVLAALAIGVNVAAKWIRYRHLTWMIV